MAYVLVFTVALATGALVFWLTLRAGRDAVTVPDGDGFLAEQPAGGSYAGDGTYVPVASDRRSWQTRAAGALGLLIAITLAAALLAFALYQAGSAIADLLSKAAS
jgi:hypothetical protein